MSNMSNTEQHIPIKCSFDITEYLNYVRKYNYQSETNSLFVEQQ